MIYLGEYDSPASLKAYSRIVDELAESPLPAVPTLQHLGDLRVVELCAEYKDFCVGYYRKNDMPTRYVDQIELSLNLLSETCGETRVREFGPRALKAFRQTMIARKLSRNYINAQIRCLKRMFKWGVEEELVPPSVHQALICVTGLRKGRSEARETAPIGPVSDEVIEATIFYLPAVVASMVRLQRVSGRRTGEKCQSGPWTWIRARPFGNIGRPATRRSTMIRNG